MLTKRENFIQTVKGGNPDRFVNQYEYLSLIFDPILANCCGMCPPGSSIVNDWGMKIIFIEGHPGPYPDCEGENKVLKDITQWKSVLKAPDPNSYTDEQWADAQALAKSVDRKETFCSLMWANGLFEKLHYLMGMEDALMNFYTEPEAMHELIDFLTDWEIECAKVMIKRLQPDALYHHDDWGSKTNSFLSPDMFEEFLLPAYKKIYGYYKNNGIEYIIHHSDSYAANLVPFMIDMGIDVWQGAVSDNNIPELLKKYGGKISIHGGLDNGKYDCADWSVEKIRAGLKDLFETAGTKYLIPGLTMGGPESSYPGVYEAATKEIDEFSKIYFK